MPCVVDDSEVTKVLHLQNVSHTQSLQLHRIGTMAPGVEAHSLGDWEKIIADWRGFVRRSCDVLWLWELPGARLR